MDIINSNANHLFMLIQVQVLEPSSKDELQQRMEFLQPSAVYFTGEVDPSRQEFGSLFVGDLELCNADDIISLFKGKLPNLVGVLGKDNAFFPKDSNISVA